MLNEEQIKRNWS